MDAEDVGFAKPSCGDKLIAARTRAYEQYDMNSVATIDSTIKKPQDSRRLARHRKKARKLALKEQIRKYAFRNRVSDPLSEKERQ